MDSHDPGLEPSRRGLIHAGVAGATLTGLGLASGTSAHAASLRTKPAPTAAPAPAAPTRTGGLTFADGHGLTVRDATRWDWERRLVYLRLGTREVTGWGGGGPGVNVLLPAGYDDHPDRRYPVVYLFHGGGDEVDFRQWHEMTAPGSQRSLLLDETADTEAVYVMPDISKGCWGLDARHEFFWLRRNWETFHLDQLVPWVDANFRTLGTPEGRAVLGYSMGGFAAVHHMAKRPELFAAVSSYSGPSDVGHHSLQTYMYCSVVVDGLNPGALLGKPVRWDASMVPDERIHKIPPIVQGGDPAVWDTENPRALLDSYVGKRVALIAGDDTEDANEGPVIIDQPQLADLLREHGVEDVTQYQVAGNHHRAVKTAFHEDLPRVLEHLTPAG